MVPMNRLHEPWYLSDAVSIAVIVFLCLPCLRPLYRELLAAKRPPMTRRVWRMLGLWSLTTAGLYGTALLLKEIDSIGGGIASGVAILAMLAAESMALSYFFLWFLSAADEAT